MKNLITKLKPIFSNAIWALIYFFWAFVKIFHIFYNRPAFWAAHSLIAIQCLIIGFFFVIRHPTEKVSRNPIEILIAILTTFSVLLLRLDGDIQINILGVAIQIIGVLFTLFAAVSLNRSWGIVPANRGVKTSGAYRWVRHPIYASYLVFYIGFMTSYFSWYNLMIVLASFSAQAFRIYSEEKLLSSDPVYAAYKNRVRWRMIPFIW